MTPRRYRFVRRLLALMLGAAIVAAALDAFAWELFYLLSLVSLLAVAEVTAPYEVTPPWRRRITRVVIAGLVGFSLLVARRLVPIVLRAL